MFKVITNLLKEESGQDTLEYVFLGLIIALGAVAGMGTLATAVNAEFGKLGNGLT